MKGRKNIVLVHGWGQGSVKLVPLQKELHKRGWQARLVRLPGFELPDPPAAWGVREYADYVESKLPSGWKKAGYVWFGHSFGGRLAVRAAVELKQGLRGIILCAPGGFEARNTLKLAVFKGLASLGRGVVGENELARKVLYKLAGVTDYKRTDGVMREVFKKVVGEDLTPLLAAIETPVLILWGDKDRVVPVTGGAFIKDRVQNGRLEIAVGEGHLLPYTKPGWVTERIEEWAG